MAQVVKSQSTSISVTSMNSTDSSFCSGLSIELDIQSQCEDSVGSFSYVSHSNGEWTDDESDCSSIDGRWDYFEDVFPDKKDLEPQGRPEPRRGVTSQKTLESLQVHEMGSSMPLQKTFEKETTGHRRMMFFQLSSDLMTEDVILEQPLTLEEIDHAYTDYDSEDFSHASDDVLESYLEKSLGSIEGSIRTKSREFVSDRWSDQSSDLDMKLTPGDSTRALKPSLWRQNTKSRDKSPIRIVQRQKSLDSCRNFNAVNSKFHSEFGARMGSSVAAQKIMEAMMCVLRLDHPETQPRRA